MQRISALLWVIWLCTSCNAELEKTSSEEFRQTISGEAQGTTWRIVYYDLQERDFTPDVDSILKRIDASVSTYLEGSTIDGWNKSDSGTTIDPLFLDLLMKSWDAYVLTEGAFDPTVKPLVSFWGFGPERLAHPEEIDPATIDSLLHLVNFDTLTLVKNDRAVDLASFEHSGKKSADYFLYKPMPEMQLDFNAIGQGWSVDRVVDFLKDKELKVFFVEIGGELVAGYPKPGGELWRFGIDQPSDGNYERDLQAVIKLRNKGMATSGNYRKFYEKDGIRYSHTIDPKTGYPVQHQLLSATVVSESAGKADALATAFMVMGADSTIQFVEARKYLGSYIYLISDDQKGGFSTYQSRQLTGMLEE
ncbi:MAG: FAD:protein FMN transferase [Flavobacteriales bacterium]|nr:FAD:protein FMN transferase [Flavobacteriales bacterium]